LLQASLVRATAEPEPVVSDPQPPALVILTGNGSPPDDLLAAVERRRVGGRSIEVLVTRRPGDAARFAAEAAATGVHDLIAAGGDGTVHEVVRGLADAAPAAAPALGIVPLGTANDFATELGVPDDVDAALGLALSGAVRNVDIGWVGDRPVVNMATGGFGTDVTVETPEGMKEALGRLAYLLTGLRRIADFRAEPITVRTASGEWSGGVVALAIGNGRRAGGSVTFCPQARIDDGELDVTLVPGEGEGISDALRLLLEGGADWRSLAVTSRSPWVEIEAPRGLALNLDGEPCETHALRFEVRPGALRLRVPGCSPLLGCEEE
jgi:lipid kinase YegS